MKDSEVGGLTPHPGTRVLVADEEPLIRDMVTEVLRVHGYVVTTASSAAEALAAFQRDEIQLVIFDITGSQMNGLELLEAVKRLRPSVQVVMIAGYNMMEKAVTAMKHGASDVLRMPFSDRDILSAVDRALDSHEWEAMVSLYESSRVIFSTFRLEDLLPKLMDLALPLLRVDDASVMLLEGGMLRVAASRGLFEARRQSQPVRLGERVAGKVAQLREPVMIQGPLRNDPRFEGVEGYEGIAASIVCPLIGRDGVIGVLNVNRVSSDRPFREAEWRLATIFSGQVAQAIENARLHQQLEENVRQARLAAWKLDQAKTQLARAERLSVMGRLVAEVAHELNNPLTSVVGFTDIVLQGELPEGVRNDLSCVKEQAERCRDIIVNMLKATRREEPKNVPIEVGELLRRTLGLFERELAVSGVAVETVVEPSLPPVEGDPLQLQQVFLNLLTNAKQAMVRREGALIRVEASLNGDHVMMKFRDNGPGMAPDVLSKLFTPFFTTKPVGEGTGLGLNISANIVKKIGGHISVESQEGEGATFTLQFPAFVRGR